MRSNLIIFVLALLGAFAAAEYNQYSHCREWRLELALREQGVVPERSSSAATVEFLAGDLVAVSEKWRCGIEIKRGEAAWAAVEAITIVPAAGSAAAWTLRTVGRGFARMAALLRDARMTRGFPGLVRGPTALVGKITARRIPMLVLGGALLAVYFGSSQLLLDALALLPWVIQWAVWALLLFCIARFIWFSVQATAALRVPLRALWSRLIRPRLLAHA